MSDQPAAPKEGRRRLHWAVESILIFAVGVVIAMLIRTFAFQAFEIPSTSMVDTLLVGDRVIVNKLSYRGDEVPERGDIVVFERPNVAQCQFAPTDPEDLIKRVIGLPGEEVAGIDGTIYIDGAELAEPWFDQPVTSKDFPPISVPDGTVLVLGDNRTNSRDGTCFGPIRLDSILGRAMWKVWPLGRAGGL